MLRRQLPVYSPLNLRALWAGLGGSRRSTEELQTTVVELIRTRHRPLAVQLTNSGTSALQLAIAAATRDRPNAVIAIPSYSCYDVATAAIGANVSVILYDMDPRTLGPDFDSLQQTLAKGATTVVVAHLYGVPVDLDAVKQMTADADAVLIEDAAQGAGAMFHGQPLGSGGSLGVLSFGRGKGVTAGSGGALLASDSEGVALLARIDKPEVARHELTNLTKLAAQWLVGRPSMYTIPASIPGLGLGKTTYRSPVEPAELGPRACAVLAETWRLADKESAERGQNAERLLNAVSSTNARAVLVPPDRSPGYLRLPVLLPSSDSFGNLRAGERLGIMPGYPQTMADVEPLRPHCVNLHEDFPGARVLVERLVTLPTHSLLTEADLSKLEAWLRALPPHIGNGRRPAVARGT